MNILAKSCLCPGVCALVSNLVSSKDAPQEINDSWQDEYCDGCSYEIYGVALGVDFEGLSFGEAAIRVYDKLEVTLFAIEIRYASANLCLIRNSSSSLTLAQDHETLALAS